MKRLIFSDLHLHQWAYGATVTEGEFNSRLYAQFLAAQQMVDHAQDLGVEYAYCCGDIFHQHGTVSTQALMLATRIFDMLRHVGIQIRAIPGNHDQSTRSGSIHSLSWLREDEIYGQWVDGGLRVVACPYTTSEDVLKRHLENVAEGEGGMLMLHQGVAGVPLGSGFMLDEKLDPSMIPDNVKAFTGHYHFHSRPSENLTIVGNLAPINWGDLDQSKGWVIWDDVEDTVVHHLQNKAPDFMTWSQGQAKHSDLANVENAFVRYTTPVSVKQQKDVRKELKEAGALAVEFPAVKVSKKQAELRSGEAITVEHILSEFDKRDTGRRREVGIQVREAKYANPVD